MLLTSKNIVGLIFCKASVGYFLIVKKTKRFI